MLTANFFFDVFFFIANYLFFVPAIFLGPYCEHNFIYFSVNSSYTSHQGGCLFLCRHHFFYLPMLAQNFLISWHITIFAVHGFCGDLVFLCSYPTVGRANFLFFTFTQKGFVHVTILFYFKARHLLKNIFHYASPCCVYSLTCHCCGGCFSTRYGEA